MTVTGKSELISPELDLHASLNPAESGSLSRVSPELVFICIVWGFSEEDRIMSPLVVIAVMAARLPDIAISPELDSSSEVAASTESELISPEVDFTLNSVYFPLNLIDPDVDSNLEVTASTVSETISPEVDLALSPVNLPLIFISPEFVSKSAFSALIKSVSMSPEDVSTEKSLTDSSPDSTVPEADFTSTDSAN
jgi:hypothetical protein